MKIAREKEARNKIKRELHEQVMILRAAEEEARLAAKKIVVDKKTQMRMDSITERKSREKLLLDTCATFSTRWVTESNMDTTFPEEMFQLSEEDLADWAPEETEEEDYEPEEPTGGTAKSWLRRLQTMTPKMESTPRLRNGKY